MSGWFITWLAIFVIGALVVVGLQHLALANGGLGAVVAFIGAAVVVAFVVWAYQHQRGPQKPPERR